VLWNKSQDFGGKSQDVVGPVVLNSNHNNKNNLCVLCHWRSRRQATTAALQLFNRVRAEQQVSLASVGGDSGMINAEAMNSVTEKNNGGVLFSPGT
jgi:hypothetical protein